MKADRKKYKILQITHAQFPPAIRLVKEGLTLYEAGYCSAVLCPPYGDQREYESWQGIDIYRPKVLSNRSILDKLLHQAIFYSPAWHKAIQGTTARKYTRCCSGICKRLPRYTKMVSLSVPKQSQDVFL